jgi:hypothetical protein
METDAVLNVFEAEPVTTAASGEFPLHGRDLPRGDGYDTVSREG